MRLMMKKKILITLGSIIGILIIAVAGYAFYLYSSVKDTANQMHETVKLDTPHEKPISAKTPVNLFPFCSWALMSGPETRGRSDTLIAMTLSRKVQFWGSMTFTSMKKSENYRLILLKAFSTSRLLGYSKTSK